VIVSLPGSTDKSGGPYRKPRADVYTVLLAVALVALLIGILCLYLEMKAYDWKIRGGPSVMRPAASAIAFDSPAAMRPAPHVPPAAFLASG
jgi:hypothetical protein